MSKRNEIPALAATLLIMAALLGVGAWWVRGQLQGGTISEIPIGNSQPNSSSSSNRSSTTINTLGADGTSGLSVLPDEVSETKQKGLDALASRDYETAAADFAAALAADRNDPESVIYLNNANIGESEAYVIAMAVPASSEFIGPALEIMRGVAQAQRDINEAGGINGIPLKVLLVNDQGTPATSYEVAEALVADDRVLGVVGHYTSDMTLSAAAAYEAGGLAMVSPTSTAVKISNAGEYIFRTVPSDRLAAASLARYVINDIKKRRAAVFYAGDSAYSRSVQSEFTTELLSNGGEVVVDFDVNKPGFSAGQALQEANQADVDVIMLALTEETSAKSLQVLSVNNGELPVVGGDSLYDFNILDVGRDDAVGLTVAVPWHILSHAQSDFVKASRQLWGAAVNWRTVTAYDAVMTLAAAIDAGGATRGGVQGALSEAGFGTAGATDEVRFFPTGDRNQPSQLVTVVKKENSISGTGYDYEPKK